MHGQVCDGTAQGLRMIWLLASRAREIEGHQCEACSIRSNADIPSLDVIKLDLQASGVMVLCNQPILAGPSMLEIFCVVQSRHRLFVQVNDRYAT